MYLSFANYQAMGGKLNETDFKQAEFIARKNIDMLTHNRIKEPVSDSVKLCVHGLIERGYTGALNGKDVTGMSNDGRSVSYESKKGKTENFIRTCLSGEPGLFYAGF